MKSTSSSTISGSFSSVSSKRCRASSEDLRKKFSASSYSSVLRSTRRVLSFSSRVNFDPMGAISSNRPAYRRRCMSPKLTSARAFIILPNRLSAAFKNGFFSIVRAKLITEEESSRRTPKLGLAGHHRKRLAAECATCPCNILEMADVHHIPPLSRSRAPALGNEKHCPAPLHCRCPNPSCRYQSGQCRSSTLKRKDTPLPF